MSNISKIAQDLYYAMITSGMVKQAIKLKETVAEVNSSLDSYIDSTIYQMIEDLEHHGRDEVVKSIKKAAESL